MNSHRTWADIVSEIQNSGLDQLNEQSKEQRARSQLYKNQLLQEMSYHREKQKKLLLEKRRQRSMIELKAKKDLELDYAKKRDIKDKELSFKQDNLSLLNTRRQGDNESNSQKFKEHPFVKLVDQQDARRAKRTYNLQESYKFNHILQAERTRNREANKSEDAEKINSHLHSVNEMFDKIDSNRRKYVNQYLRDKVRIQTEPDSLQKEYAMFLNQQINDKKDRLGRQKEVTGIQDAMNSHLNTESSSPAFLGRIPYNHDRKIQLQYLNRQLKKNQKRLFKKDQRTTAQRNYTIESILSENSTPRANPEKERPKFPTIETRSEIGKKQAVRTFRQLNVITGGLDYRQV